MSILERAGSFVEKLRDLDRRTSWQWRECVCCGSKDTIKNGHYMRHPWTLKGRQDVPVQRHYCRACGRSYSEQSAGLIRGSWYGRGVHRAAIDHWQHGGSSLRRVAELARSWLGQQERWRMWMSLDDEVSEEERCWLGASTVHRWLDRAGIVAQQSVRGQMKGIACSGEMGTDGVWARMRDGSKRVGLMLIDYVSGLVWPPVVAEEEASGHAWARLFRRAEEAGLKIERLNGITSDGAQGLASYLRDHLSGVHQQRCVWHLWRSLSQQIARQVARAVAHLPQEQARQERPKLRRQLSELLRRCLDADSYEEGEQALAIMAAHALGGSLARALRPLLDAVLMFRLPCHSGLNRVGPEWYWRDFRQRLCRGRNHGSEQRLERALLVWAIYRNFTPAQKRSEQKRHYRHPGQSPFEVAGYPPGRLSYLDALEV